MVEDDDDESTDSEFELDLDVEDGISIQVQDELSKYLSKNKTMVKKLDPKVKDFLGKYVNKKELTKVARSSQNLRNILSYPLWWAYKNIYVLAEQTFAGQVGPIINTVCQRV